MLQVMMLPYRTSERCQRYFCTTILGINFLHYFVSCLSSFSFISLEKPHLGTEQLGYLFIFIQFDRVVACVAGGISHASAFVLVAKP